MSRYKEIAQVFSADELQAMEDSLRLSLKCAEDSDAEFIQALLYLVNGSFWAGKFAEEES